MKRGFSIGQIAERTGLSLSAIRFYEDQGLVHPGRNRGGQRAFERADIRRLSFIMIAQELGFSLAQIKQVLAPLPRDRAPTKAEWSRISQSFRADLDARITKLTALRDKLDGCIGCGCLSLEACQLYNAQDRARRRGPGPRYLLGDAPQSSD